MQARVANVEKESWCQETLEISLTADIKLIIPGIEKQNKTHYLGTNTDLKQS